MYVRPIRSLFRIVVSICVVGFGVQTFLLGCKRGKDENEWIVSVASHILHTHLFFLHTPVAQILPIILVLAYYKNEEFVQIMLTPLSGMEYSANELKSGWQTIIVTTLNRRHDPVSSHKKFTKCIRCTISPCRHVAGHWIKRGQCKKEHSKSREFTHGVTLYRSMC